MALRSSMAALIARVRSMINDTAGATQQFADTEIQDVLDESRQAVYNGALKPIPTFSGATIQYLNYEAELGSWEDDLVLKQFLITVVTPATSENIVGRWTFAATALPPVFITGKTYDVYCAAADLLERWSARYATRFDFSSDSQSFHVSQAMRQLQKLAQSYRASQRAGSLNVMRSDLQQPAGASNALGPQPIDYY
jgi:hypothetical protein